MKPTVVFVSEQLNALNVAVTVIYNCFDLNILFVVLDRIPVDLLIDKSYSVYDELLGE